MHYVKKAFSRTAFNVTNIVIFLKFTKIYLYKFCLIAILMAILMAIHFYALPVTVSSYTERLPNFGSGSLFVVGRSLEVRCINIPPQTCSLLVRSAKCRDTAVVYHFLTCRVCWSPRNTADNLALLD